MDAKGRSFRQTRGRQHCSRCSFRNRACKSLALADNCLVEGLQTVTDEDVAAKSRASTRWPLTWAKLFGPLLLRDYARLP